MEDEGSANRSYSTLLRKIVIRETHSNSAICDHVKDKEDKYSNCSLLMKNFGLPRLPVKLCIVNTLLQFLSSLLNY
jgi:hypothetical protein